MIFHPYELGFVGFSNTFKTSIISKVASLLKDEFDIGYIKSSCHNFDDDFGDCKDTSILRNSGSLYQFIYNKKATIFYNADSFDLRTSILRADFVLHEGGKDLVMPKIVLLDEDELINYNIDNVVAFIGKGNKREFCSLPYFNCNDIASISSFVKEYFLAKMQVKLNGLVLTGGKSERMGFDKAKISYHSSSMSRYLVDLLQNVCSEVFISARNRTTIADDVLEEKVIYDRLLNYGPMSGILSAMEYDKNSAWFVVACDLPFVTLEALQGLKEAFSPSFYATCFRSYKKNSFEPLCTIYSPKIRERMYYFLSQGMYCPRKVLHNSRVKVLDQREDWLKNINSIHDMKEANL